MCAPVKEGEIRKLSRTIICSLVFPLRAIVLEAGDFAPPEGYIHRQAIQFKETGKLSEEAIRFALPDSISAAVALDTLKAVQKLLHRKLGYYRSRVASHRWIRSPKGKVSGLEVRIQPGKLTRLGRIEVRGASPAEKRKLLELCPLSPGDAVTEKRIEKTLETIVRFYAGRGYPFCVSRVAEVGWESHDGLALVFSIERGKFVRIGRIHINGANQTRPEIIKRIAALAEGEPYNEKRIERAVERLLVSGLFSRASRPRVTAGAEAGLADLHLSLREFPAHRIEAAIGSGGGGRTSGLAGVVRIGLSNLFGTAREASINWQRPRKEWVSLQLAYREPWLAHLPIGLEAVFSQQVRDSLYTNTGGRIALSSELTDRLRVDLGTEYSEASPGSETYSFAESSTFWAVTGQAAWSNFTRVFNPAAGFEFTGKASAGSRRTDSGPRRELRTMLRMGLYQPLAPRSHILAVACGFGLVSRGQSAPEDIPYHARIPIGGALGASDGAMVRGHLEEEARGRRVGWMNLEYRYIIGENNRLFAFYDLGAAQLSATARNYLPGEESASWRTEYFQGYGAGLQLESRLGLLQLSIAFTPEKGPGGGRLHLRLAESF
jgi:outer membrane protein assembly factor BamA